MNQTWLEFLHTQNAHIHNSSISDFGDPAQELGAIDDGMVIADLGHYGLVEIAGEDAADFMQNQFTNDAREVTDSTSQLSNYCSPKGRILASFRLFKWKQCYYLRMPQDTIPATIKRLRMFVLRSKVTINDVSESFSCLGVAGKGCAEQLKAAGMDTLPSSVNEVHASENLLVIRLPGTTERYEIHGSTDVLIELWTKLKNQPLTPVAIGPWRLYDIRAAIPDVEAVNVEAFIPQMLNMQAIDGVSFTKGCYPGQEIVARTQYLGKVKRHMYMGRAEKSDITAGDEVIASGSTDSQRNGIIISAQTNAHGETEFLAVIPATDADSSILHLKSDTGPVVKLEPLPYTLERSK